MCVKFPVSHPTVSQRLYVFSCSFTRNISGTRMGMFMIYLCIKFHLSNCKDLSVLLSNEKLNKILHGCHVLILHYQKYYLNPLNAELNPICYLLALLGAQHFLHVSRIRAKSLILRLLMLYIYGAPILDVSRSHTTTQHSR